jgi:hypothetical protein
MSRTKRNHQAGSMLDRTSQTVAQAKPLARRTAAAASRRVRRTRAWAAPRVERSGQVLQDSIAPRISAALSSAAQRLAPARPRRGRWRKLADVSMLTAAASAVAAFIRNRRQRDGAASAGEPDTHEMMPAAGTGEGPTSTNSRADANTDGRARTSGTASR